MSGKDQVLNAFTLTPPVWCGDFLGRDQLLPGGVMLDPALFATTYVDVLVTVHYTVAQAYAGTGNGTMTGLTVSRTAPAEVWTITLKTAVANAGVFSVVGSVSGAKADATVGVAYDNGFVAFTINDGSTDFIVGDHFTVTVTGVDAGATSIPTDALPAAIAPNSTLNFGIPGIMAVTEAGAANGATAIVVLPLDRGVPNGSTYTVPGDTHKNVPSGTVIGRTFAERDAAGLFGPVADGDDEVYLIAYDVPNIDRTSDAAVVRANAGVVVKENFLPGFTALTATQKGYVRAKYICVVGAP